YQSYEWIAPSTMPLEVKPHKELRFVVEMDINRWFTEASNPIDPIRESATHSIGEGRPLAEKLTANMKKNMEFFSELVTP
ncbi:MAG: hypothetical protein RML72_12350, partial [Bacteroidia bacterium]|nr:hypothetical protein [Bacteroidia bacterium]MDW8159649.1 hypothetical protein [Bacteroidia bacterium]